MNVEKETIARKLCIKEVSVSQMTPNQAAHSISLPANATYDFKNPLIAIEQVLETSEFNFKLKRGDTTALTTNSKNSELLLIESPKI